MVNDQMLQKTGLWNGVGEGWSGDVCVFGYVGVEQGKDCVSDEHPVLVMCLAGGT